MKQKNKKTHKLTAEQKQELIDDFKGGRIDLKGAMEKYSITGQSARDYKRKAFISNAPMGRVSEVAELEKPTEEEETIEAPKQEEKEETLKSLLALDEEEPKETKASLEELGRQIDPNLDYCATCYRNGKIIEIKRGRDISCPSCQKKLNW